MKYQVYIEASARRFMRKLPRYVQKRLDPAIMALADTPRPAGCVLLAGHPNTYRIRVGDFRVLYRIYDDRLVVLIIRIGHRGDIYRRLMD